MVLIRSLKKEKERGSKVVIWWMSQRNGYTDTLMKAGVYHEDIAAEVIAAGTPEGNVMVNIDLARENVNKDGCVEIASLDQTKILDALAKLARFKQTRDKAETTGTCISCAGEAKTFKDALSRREYAISKLCQKCQDSVFGDADNAHIH